MRVLHLLNQTSPQATATTLNLLATATVKVPAEHQVLLLGGEPLNRAADAAGVDAYESISAPCGHAVTALPGLRYWLSQHGQPDMLHCWSVGTLLLASMCCRKLPRLLTLTLMPSPREIHLLRMLAQDAGSQLGIVTCSSTIARELLTHGVRPESVDVMRPGIDMSLIQNAQRQSLRDSWELAGDQPYVVSLLSDPPTQADAATAALLIGLTLVSMNNPNRPIHLLLHPDQKNRIEALNPMRPLDCTHMIITDAKTATPWQVLPGCDAAIAMSDCGAGLSLPWAMAANVPIIGHATAAICEWVEDHHSALLVAPGQQSIRHLAGKLQQVLTDEPLTYKLRDTARHEAFSFYSRTRYASDLNTVYNQLLEAQPIKVPDMPSTGGLRFTGRG